MIKVDRMKLAKSQGDGTYHIGSQVMDDIKEGYAVALNTTTFDVGLVIITKNESMNYQGHPVKHYGV